MGEIKLNGLGYDTKPSYENNLKGLNAGYLNYSKTRLQGHPRHILSVEIDLINLPVLFERHINLMILATKMPILNCMIYILKTTNRQPKLNFSSA